MSNAKKLLSKKFPLAKNIPQKLKTKLIDTAIIEEIKNKPCDLVPS